jgi:hypothetical protein
LYNTNVYGSVRGSVADPGCLSRIPDSNFYPSRIPDPKTAKKWGMEKNFVIPFFVVTNFTKLRIILFLNAEDDQSAGSILAVMLV